MRRHTVYKNTYLRHNKKYKSMVYFVINTYLFLDAQLSIIIIRKQYTQYTIIPGIKYMIEHFCVGS